MAAKSMGIGLRLEENGAGYRAVWADPMSGIITCRRESSKKEALLTRCRALVDYLNE